MDPIPEKPSSINSIITEYFVTKILNLCPFRRITGDTELMIKGSRGRMRCDGNGRERKKDSWLQMGSLSGQQVHNICMHTNTLKHTHLEL